MTTTISREFNTDLCQTIEDSVAHVIDEYTKSGTGSSATRKVYMLTAYKMLESFVVAKQAEFGG